ncbi:MAG: SCO family protein [Gammaproteobacteria bacterium]|nr:SCO family protein [Gammaproteobacteria bacterium]
MASTDRSALILLVLVAVLAFALGIHFARRTAPEAGAPVEGMLWPDPPRLESFTLDGADGKPLTEATLRGKWSLLFFGFTHCPDVCPTTLATLRETVKLLEETPDFAQQGQVVLVSVDPARDTPEALAGYVGHFDRNFLAATAPPDRLAALTGQLGILHTRVPLGSGEEYSVDHTASILLIGPGLERLAIFSAPHAAPELAAKIGQIIQFLQDSP